MKKIAIGSDHAGFELKEEIINFLLDKYNKYEVEDFGTFEKISCDYPIIGKKVSRQVSIGLFDLGILICGTGLGMSIVSNKERGVRAVCCTDCYSAKMSRVHNNANILCLGQRVLGKGLALEIVQVWLESEFTDEKKHKRRVEMLEENNK